MSANGCSSPSGPTRYGPTRCCMSAATLRSAYTIAADASSMQTTKTDDSERDAEFRIEDRCTVRAIVRAQPASRARAACSGPRGCAPRTRRGSAGSCSAPARPPRRRTGTASCRRCCSRRSSSRSMSRIAPSPRSMRVQDLEQPVGALAARRALAARLVPVEVQQVLGQPTPCRSCRPSRSMAADPSIDPAFTRPSKLACASSWSRQEHRRRRAAGDDRLERPPAAHAAARSRRSARAA